MSARARRGPAPAPVSRRRRWPFVVAATLAAISLLAVIAERQRWLEMRLAQALEERLGVAVDIGAIALAGAPPTVFVRHLRLGPAGAPLLAVDELALASAGVADLLAGRIERVRAVGVAWRPAGDGEVSPAWPSAGGSGDGGARRGLPQIVVEQARLSLAPVAGVGGQLRLARLGLTPAHDGARAGLTVSGSLAIDRPIALTAEFVVGADIDLATTSLRSVDAGGRIEVPGRGVANDLRLRVGELAVAAAARAELRGIGASAMLAAADDAAIGVALSLPAIDIAADHLSLPLVSLAATSGRRAAGLWASLGEVRADASAVRGGRLSARLAAQPAALPTSLALAGSFAFQRAASKLAIGLQSVELTVAAGMPDALRLSAAGEFQADLAAAAAKGRITGSLDDAPLALAFGFDAADDPPAHVSGALRRLDLGRLTALLGTAGGAGARDAGATPLPDWPLVVDLRVARLEDDGLTIEDGRLRYRPAPQRRAE
ncbi:MAG: hypothetical protein KDH15_15475 [Rhodocyclaceae bacterium]|nr:hypothetical protein [Rhodocyclaceae bacterium]